MSFESISDDFFVNLDLQTTLALPTNRETILHFIEAMQKAFPSMTNFFQRENGYFVLEGDRESGSYPWMEFQTHQLSAGYFNPPDLNVAHALHRWMLDRCVYFLGVSGMDVASLDVLYGFNLDYRGNRDQIVADALLAGSPLGTLSSEYLSAECQPNLVLSLSEDCYSQARLLVETRGNTYQIRTGNYEDDPISVYLTVRQYPVPGSVLQIAESYPRQCETAEELLTRIVIPNIIHPISQAIATAQ